MTEFNEKVIAMLDLPQKFLVMSKCSGCVHASFYMSKHIERVEAYFAVTPLGFEPAKTQLDIYKFPPPPFFNPKNL